MKFLLLFLLSTLVLSAKSSDTCYSVQLSSFVIKNKSSYDFESQDYPRYCALVEFGRVNTVRCGCFEEYESAQKEQQNLQYFYPQAMIVSSYKSRFKDMPYKDSSIKRESKRAKPKKEQSEREKTQNILTTSAEPKNLQELQTPQTPSRLENLQVTTDIALEAQHFIEAPKEKNMQNLTLSTNLNLEYKEDALTLRSKLKAQADYSDFATSQKNERSYLRLDELYGQYDFLDDQIVVGKSIRFWGALELRNITDGFNPTELRDDPFAMDKLGVWNASYAHYFDTSELSIIAKLYEPQREMAGYPYVYYYFPSQINSLPNQYSNSLKSEKSQTRPSLYLKYSGTTEGDYSIDYAFIFQNGYDSQRYFSSSVLGDAITNIPYKTQLQENAYLVNKFSTYNTMVLGATLYKLEALYADVIDNEEISDYMHIGLGVEHTLYGVYENADLALLLEYYNYSTFEDGKRDDLALFELFQNDLFVGLRLSLNDAKESKITTGAIIDMEYDEQVYYIEYESRLNDIFVLDFDYRYIAPSPSDLTAFKLMGRHQRVGLKVGYAF